MIEEEKEEWRIIYENENYQISLLGQIRNKTTKCVNQYARKDKDKRKILRTFNSSKEAAEFVKLKSKSKTSISSIMKFISGVCIGVQNTAYGHRWGYEKEIVY